MIIQRDDIKSPEACIATIDDLSNHIEEIAHHEPEYQFSSLVAEEHFRQALIHLEMSRSAMSLASLTEARERGNKAMGR